jgi:endonuclease III
MSNAPRWRFERCTDPPASLTPPDLSKAPYGWKEQYEIIRKLRKSCKAPYDTDGPELLPNKLQGENVFHWQCLVAAILCGQSDHPAGVAASFRRLVVDTCNDDNFNFSQFSVLAAGGLTDAQIAGKIKGSPCASFGGKKASFIKMGADYINSKCDGKVPTTFTALKALPGVGVNTANLTLGFMGKPYTMPIYDPQEYIHTLCERMGWFKGGNFSDTIKSLETWFPYQGWHQLPRMLIGLGQILEEDAGVLVEAALSGADPLPAIKFLADIGVPLTRFAKSPSNEIHPYTVKFDVKTLAESKGLQDVVAYLESREEVDKQIEERLARKLAREAEEQKQRESAEAAARKESMARMAARQAARKSGNVPISNSNVPDRGLVKASNVPNRSIPNAPSTTKKRHSEGRKSVDGRKSGDIRKYAVEGKLGKERLSEMKSAEKKLVPALASARVSTGGEKRKFSDMKELNDALNARAHQKAAMRGEEVDMKKLMKEKNKAFAAMKKMKAGKASATPQQVRRQSKSDDVEIEPIFKPVPLMDGSAASSSDQAKKRPSDAKAKLILEQMKAKKRRTIG